MFHFKSTHNFKIESQAKSIRSTRSKAMSLRSRVESEKKKSVKTKQECDQTTTTSKREQTVEARMASQIAVELLRDNQKIRGIHSNVSIKKLIEKEAKR